MCGVFGVITSANNGLWQSEKGFIADAFQAGAVRGTDGTGVFFVPHDKLDTPHWMKTVGHPYNLFQEEIWPKFWEHMDRKAKCVVAHNRYATRGKLTTDNTHPFCHEHITMVHNGTISSGLTYDKDVEVDSHALTINLARDGLDIFSKIWGAFVCIWHDSRDNSLNFARNDQRPLTMVKLGEKYFFASEAGMLFWLLQRNYKGTDKPHLVEIKPNFHYKFDLANLGDPEVSPLPEKKTYQTTYTGSTGTHTGSSSTGCSNHYGYYGDRKDSTKKLPAPSKKRQIRETAQFQIKKKTLEVLTSGVELWNYFGVSSNNEAVYFRSQEDLPVNDTWYDGEITGYDLDKFAFWGRGKVWYRIKTATLLVIPDPTKVEVDDPEVSCELIVDEAGNTTVRAKGNPPQDNNNHAFVEDNNCFICSTEIAETKRETADVVRVGPITYRYACASCFALFLEETTPQKVLH